MYLAGPPPHEDREAWSAAASSQVMEGGQRVEEALASYRPERLDALMAVEVAMYIEAQALDLYLRLYRKAGDQAARQALLELGQEEKSHLQALGLMVRQLSQDS